MSQERPAMSAQTVWELTAEYWKTRNYHPISGDASTVLRRYIGYHQAVAMGGPIHGQLVAMPEHGDRLVVSTMPVPPWRQIGDNVEPATSVTRNQTTYSVRHISDGRPVLAWEHHVGLPNARTQP